MQKDFQEAFISQPNKNSMDLIIVDKLEDKSGITENVKEKINVYSYKFL